MMTQTVRNLVLVLPLVGLGGGCAITSASQQNSASAGGVWYTKQPLVGNTKVFYCPPEGGACYQAKVNK